MDKKILILVALVVVLAGAGGAYALLSNNQEKNSSSSSTHNGMDEHKDHSEEEHNQMAQDTNATKLASSGKAQECTFDYDGPEGSADGKMYTDGKGKSRMSITGMKTDQGNTGSSDMIVKDGKYYNWVTTNGQSIGFSGDSTSSANTDSNSSQASGQPTPNQNFPMSCKSWEVDQAKFEVPSNINFSSLNFNVPQ